MKINNAIVSAVAATLCGLSAASAQDTAIGTTSVDRWPDGKKAAFMMMFDDGCPSHVNKVSAAATSAREIKVTLTCDADASLYDQPLSLSTQVPAAWKRCKVAQGTTTTTVDVVDGKVRYNAVPNSQPIVLSQLATL